MTTKTRKEVLQFFHNHARDLYRIVAVCSKSVNITLIASNEFSDKLERRCEKAGFTIINWTNVTHWHEYDIEIEVAK